jgi:hypothetical protein
MDHWEMHEGKAGVVVGGGGRRLQGKYAPILAKRSPLHQEKTWGVGAGAGSTKVQDIPDEDFNQLVEIVAKKH